MIIELLIYMMCGLLYTFYKYKKFNHSKTILTFLFWPIDLLISFIELVDKIKQRNRRY